MVVLGVDQVVYGLKRVSDESFYLGQDVSVEIDVFFGMVVIDDSLEVIVGKFVPIFKFSIILVLLLNCVVGEVDEEVVDVVESEVFDGGAEIAVFEEVAFVLT